MYTLQNIFVCFPLNCPLNKRRVTHCNETSWAPPGDYLTISLVQVIPACTLGSFWIVCTKCWRLPTSVLKNQVFLTSALWKVYASNVKFFQNWNKWRWIVIFRKRFRFKFQILNNKFFWIKETGSNYSIKLPYRYLA